MFKNAPGLPITALMFGTLLLALVPREGRAEQFILLDAMIDYTWDDAINSKPSKSHFYVNEGNFLNKNRPKNWLSPVDYRNGTLHVRAEVFAKPPGTQTTGWTLCYIPNAGGYGCADTDYYKSTGVFERDVKMTSWWNNNQLQWAQGVKQVDMIYAINDSGSGHVSNYPALKDLTTPTRVRVTVIQVSAGATYDPSILAGTIDGGAPGMIKDAGSDAPATADTGGGASGGATGTGGTVTPPSSSGGTTGTAPGSGGASPPPGSSTSAGGVSGGCALSGSQAAGGSAALAVGFTLGLLVRARRRRRRR